MKNLKLILIISLLFGVIGCNKKTANSNDATHVDELPSSSSDSFDTVSYADELPSSSSNPFDTLLSSRRNYETSDFTFFFKDSTIFRYPSVKELDNIKNIEKITLGYPDADIVFLPDYKNISIITVTIEGEDFYSYLGTIKDDTVTDVLYIEGLSAEPGNEDEYSEYTQFAISKDYRILINEQINEKGVKTSIKKEYFIDNEGKFIEISTTNN